jgi:hypothetical protein
MGVAPILAHGCRNVQLQADGSGADPCSWLWKFNSAQSRGMSSRFVESAGSSTRIETRCVQLVICISAADLCIYKPDMNSHL